MATAYEFTGLVLGILPLVLDAVSLVKRVFDLFSLYGPPGLVLYLFGSRTTWQLEAQVLSSCRENDALEFRKSVQDECVMISVAVRDRSTVFFTITRIRIRMLIFSQAAIIAQIAITALSLNNLSQTHWIVRGFLVFSLISALLAVYYATTQQRAIGRLLTAKQIRHWIRGGPSRSNSPWINVAFPIFKANLKALHNEHYRCDPEDLTLAMIGKDSGAPGWSKVVLRITQCCFIPAVSSVITLSAPQVVLSMSLMTLVIALGIYLGFTWTKNLDPGAGIHDSRNVFIMYVVGLSVCLLIYSISQIVSSQDLRSEQEILYEHLSKYMSEHKDVADRWFEGIERPGIHHSITSEQAESKMNTTGDGSVINRTVSDTSVPTGANIIRDGDDDFAISSASKPIDPENQA